MPARPAPASEALLSTGEAARRCGVPRRTLLRAARRGDLPARGTPGGHLRFRPADIDAFAARLAHPLRPPCRSRRAARRAGGAGRTYAQGLMAAGGARFRALIERSSDLVRVLAADTTLLYASPSHLRVLGYAPEELLARRSTLFIHPDDRPLAQETFDAVVAQGGERQVTLRMRHAQGGYRTLEAILQNRLADPAVRGIVVNSRDVTAREAAEEAQAQLAAIVETSRDAIITQTLDGVIASWNRGAAEIYGYTAAEAVGQPIALLAPPEHSGEFDGLLGRVARGEHIGEYETERVRKDGSRVPVAVTISPVQDRRGAVVGAAVVARDITAQKRAARLLAHAAHHDVLTGLPNRMLFAEHLGQALRAARRERAALALLLLDLDRFKEVNDTLGHQAGDALLQAVAARLRAAVRESDTVARLGGDEFAVLLPGAEEAGAARVAGQICAALAEPVPLGAGLAEVGGSVGIAVYPAHGEDAEALQRSADQAMYEAKRAGGGYLVYGQGAERAEATAGGLAADLRRAIEAGELRLHYQPVVRCATGQVERAEALVRWQHPRLGLLSPGRFVPLAERTGAIAALTLWVLEAAIQQCAHWRACGLDLGVSVNVSPLILVEAQLPELVGALLRHHAVPAARLTLEVTEQTLLFQPQRVAAALEGLSGVGVRLAIDDFGGGYSSLRQLRRLPVQELKLDRALLADLAGEEDAGLMSFLLGLGEALGVEMVTKGVETAVTWNWLRAMDCGLAQGYYVSRPQPAERWESWLCPGSCGPAAACSGDRCRRVAAPGG